MPAIEEFSDIEEFDTEDKPSAVDSDNPKKRQLISELDAVRKESPAGAIPDFLWNAIEPLSASGWSRTLGKAMDVFGHGVVDTVNLPTTISNNLKGSQPGMPNYTEPRFKFGEPLHEILDPFTEQEVSKFSPAIQKASGYYNAGANAINSLTTPENLFSLPFFSVNSIAKPAARALLAKTLADEPELVRNAWEINNDPNATPLQKGEAIAQAGVVNPAFAGLMAKGSMGSKPIEEFSIKTKAEPTAPEIRQEPVSVTPEETAVGRLSKDVSRYNELVSQVKNAPLDQRFGMTGEIEAIKNKYGGKPPKLDSESKTDAYVSDIQKSGLDKPETYENLVDQLSGERNFSFNRVSDTIGKLIRENPGNAESILKAALEGYKRVNERRIKIQQDILSGKITNEAEMNKAVGYMTAGQIPREIFETATDFGSSQGVVNKGDPIQITPELKKIYDDAIQGQKLSPERAQPNNVVSVDQQTVKPPSPVESSIESVTALDPASGTPLSATESLINRLETLKFAEGDVRPAAMYSFPHPEIFKSYGKATWNTAVDVAIAGVRAGKAVGDAINDAIEHLKNNTSGFDEPKTRANLEYAIKQQSASLDDIYKHFVPEPKESPSISKRISGVSESIRTGLSSRFRPLDKLAEDIAKVNGTEPKRVAHIFEQLKGSSGKAEADVFRFDQDVSRIVRGNEKDFNAYMFLRRGLDRLNQDLNDINRAKSGEEVSDLNRRRVSGYTIPELQSKLSTLEQKIGSEKTSQFQTAADLYQKHMDDSLKLQVDSGRMSQEVYDAIKSGNQFYAPFKILKYLDESSRPEGSGKKVDTVADFTKAMKGIDDPNFKVGDMLSAARHNITLSRVLAEKNNAMRKFADMADTDTGNQFVTKLKSGQDVPRGTEAVNVMRDGKTERYAVDPSVAQSIQMNNAAMNDWLSRFLRITGKPLRAGATGANLAFLPANFIADTFRQAIISKLGPNRIQDVVVYPLQLAHSLFSSMEHNIDPIRIASGKVREIAGLEPPRLYKDFLDSGASGSVLQDNLTPELLKFKEQTPASLPVRFAKSVIKSIPEFNKAVEESNKILGVKRAMQMSGAKSGKELARQFPELVSEVRRFSGSPDFGRSGSFTEAARLNLIFNFFNARLQGAIADVGRLGGAEGGATAGKTWGKLAVAIGAPTAALYYFNNLPQYKADYDQRPKWEKNNYWLIPRDRFVEDEAGNKVRDYWRIPKRESMQLAANMVEAALKFSEQNDPSAFAAFGVSSIENLSPINIQGDTGQQRMESAVSSLNPLFKTPFEISTGRDTFRHRDIVPENQKKASPENQYTDRTPELYKSLATAMPDMAPELLRSPLMLEAAVQSLSANLVNQFMPKPPVTGRSDIENSPFLAPVLRRFQGTVSTDTEAERAMIDKLQREAADEFLKRDRAARAAIKTAQSPDEIAQYVFKTLGESQESVKVFKRALDLWIADKNGITRQERAVLYLPVEQRAKYILEKVRGMDEQSKTELLSNYTQKRILTSAVMKQMGILSNPDNAAP